MSSNTSQRLPSVTTLLGQEAGDADSVEAYLLARDERHSRYRAPSLAQIDQHGSLGDLLFAVRQFLDDFRRPQTPASRRALIEPVPPLTGDARRDALLAALAEHLASGAGWAVPAWAQDEHRFLSSFWFVHQAAFDALALVTSPAAFRRRGVFLSADFLARV